MTMYHIVIILSNYLNFMSPSCFIRSKLSEFHESHLLHTLTMNIVAPSTTHIQESVPNMGPRVLCCLNHDRKSGAIEEKLHKNLGVWVREDCICDEIDLGVFCRDLGD